MDDWGNLVVSAAAVVVAIYTLANDRRQWAEEKRESARMGRLERLTASYPEWLESMKELVVSHAFSMRQQKKLLEQVEARRDRGEKADDGAAWLRDRLREDMRTFGEKGIDACTRMRAASLAIRINERPMTAEEVRLITARFDVYGKMSSDEFEAHADKVLPAAVELVERSVRRFHDEGTRALL